MKIRTLSKSIRRIIIPLGAMWLSPISHAAESPEASVSDARHASVVLLQAVSLRNSGNSLEGWYKLKTEQLTGKFNKAMIAHPDASLVVFPENSFYRYGHTFRIDQAYDSAVNLDPTADGYYVIDPEDSYEPLVNAINAIQDLAKQHRVNVVLNTVPQKVYPDRTRYASLPQSMVTNSALIIGPDGRIKDVDMKVGENSGIKDSPQTAFAMESKKLRYFKTKDGHTISYINLICAEKYNQDLKNKLAGLNADIITYGEFEGDGITLHPPVETYGIVQSGGYWLGADSAEGRADVLGFDGAKPLLNDKRDTDYVYADIPIQDSPVFGERAKITLTHEEKTIKMKRRYSNPVVIANLPTRNGRQSAVVYVSDVQSDQFTIQLVESPELNGQHTEEEVSYLVLESGVWRFPSGQVIQVGTMEIDEAVNNGLGKDSTWANGDLIRADFSHDSRVVFTQVQGEKNSSEYISTREMRPTDDSYWNYYLALERAEGVNEKAVKRNVGYVIASQGQSGKDIGQALQIGLTEKEISSHPSAISLAADLFQSTPHVFANIASYAGSDSAHLRQISSASDSNELYLMVEEDRHNDSEMRHTAERVSYLAIEGDGLLRLRDDLAENKQSNGSMEGSIANDPLMSLQAAADRQDKTATANNEDTTPESFHFLDLKNIPQGINVQNGITVSGINTRAPISVKGGKYSINGGSQIKTQGWVENGDRVHAHHTTSREGGKTVSTVVTIGGVSSAFKTTTKETSNKLPVSRAGEDQSVTQGTRVTLNGNGSSDSDGSIKRYVWKEGTKTLSTHKKFSKVFDVGTHNITLKVIDDKGAKSRDKVRITVKEKENKPPVAKAGADQNVTEGTKITLNGSGSSDSDGNIKRYVWKERDKKLSTNKKFSKVFGIGTHNITLEVTDDKDAKSRDKVKITVKKAASTVGMDRSPDAFELMSKADATGAYHVSHGSHVVSDTIIVGGINVPAPISVSGKMSDFRGIEKIDSSGEYRINYGSWRKTTGTVRNGDKVQVRHSQEKWIPMNRIITTLVIGDQRDDLISSIGTNNNERLTDIQPFSFGNETGRINTLVESPIIYPEGTKDGGVFVHVSMSSPNGEYRYNSGPGRKWSEWLSLQTSWLYMTSGIQMRLKSPSVYGESITAKINVSGSEGTFTVTAGNRPKSFDFTDINDVPMSQIQTSNEIRISGITGSVEVSVEKGSYSVNGTAFTSKQGMVKNGDRIRVRHTSARTLAAETNTTLTIGGVSDTFSSKTSYQESGASSPDDFHFQSKIGVERGKHIISDKITITGLYEGEEAVAEVTNGSLGIYPKVTISMDPRKGSYAESLKWCQAQPGFVEYKYGCKYIEYRFVELPKPYVLKNGLNIYLRILSSDQPNTTASATLKVGIKSATFSVTTK